MALTLLLTPTGKVDANAFVEIGVTLEDDLGIGVLNVPLLTWTKLVARCASEAIEVEIAVEDSVIT